MGFVSTGILVKSREQLRLCWNGRGRFDRASRKECPGSRATGVLLRDEASSYDPRSDNRQIATRWIVVDGPGRVRSPSAKFVRFLGVVGICTAAGLAIVSMWRPHSFLNQRSPLLVAASSLCLGIFLAQYTPRTAKRLPIMSVGLLILIKLAVFALALVVGQGLRLDVAGRAGLALVAVTPNGFEPFLAVAADNVYMPVAATFCWISHVAAFLVVPLFVYVSTSATATVNPLAVASLASVPFLAGFCIFKVLPFPYAALLGRFSLCVAWIAIAPQFMTVVAHARLGWALAGSKLVEMTLGVLAIELASLSLAGSLAKLLGRDQRLGNTLQACAALPNGALSVALAFQASGDVSAVPCTIAMLSSGLLYALTARVWRRRTRDIAKSSN